MRKTWRKRNLLLFCFILLLLALGYIFRYELILKFQYSRLKSLSCISSDFTYSDVCIERFWVHRVNSVERYELLKDKFDGFETDIGYNDSTHSFYVYHPPLTKEIDTLSLSRFLSKIDLDEKHLWLDTREVSASNMNEALEAMSKLGDSVVLRKSVLIELYDINAARLFAQNGYVVSFRIYDELIPRLQTDKGFLDSVYTALQEVSYVSQDYHHISIVRGLFPGKSVLTWDTRFSSFFDRGELKQLLNDPQIAIILVNIKSRYYK